MQRAYFASVLTLIALAAACSPAPTPVTELLNVDLLRSDIAALADDSMMGRKPGTEGEERAVQFLSKRFKEIGLSPLNNSYFQPVAMVGTKKDPDGSNLKLVNASGELEIRSDETITYWSTSQKEQIEISDAPLIFVGYGVQAPEYDWDDIKDYDVSGKVLLFLNNDPPVNEDGSELFGGEARTYYGRWTYKFEQAMRLGAVGAFVIHTTPSASYPFSVVQYSGAEEHFALDLPGTGYQVDLLGWIDEATSDQIATAIGSSLDGFFEMASQRDFRPLDTGYRVSAQIATKIRRVETRNVVGLLEGSDPALKDEIIVFSAHYDHLGANPDLEGEDRIYNGAWDNGAGTGAILNLASAFARSGQPLRRSLLFLACAAEESGSLGSQWFVSRPPVERSRLVADINIDMPQIFGVTADLAAIGVDTNSIGDVLREVARNYQVARADGKKEEVKVTGDPNPNAGSFYRSDQVNFAKAGIPAIFVNPGVDYVPELSFDPEEYETEHYHQVSDEINDKWDLSGLMRDLRIVIDLTLRLANDDEMPRWHAGNEFEGAWKKLHGIP